MRGDEPEPRIASRDPRPARNPTVLPAALALLALALAGPASALEFRDVAEASGVRFTHTGGGPTPWYPEMMGSGACWMDADADGYEDLLLLNGAYFDAALQARHRPTGKLYVNEGDGTFSDATARSGLAFEGYANGCAAADYDGDGCVDVYVAGYNLSRLFRSRCDASFEELPAAGIRNDACPVEVCWGHSAAWADYDEDGDLDLYVGNYLKIPRIPIEPRVNGPNLHDGQPNALYRNNGDGTFTDVAADAGVTGDPGFFSGKTLAVGWQDYDLDGDEDLFVANDETEQNLYRNDGGGRFTDVAPALGVNWTHGGMGVAWGDVDRNGCPEVAIAFYQNEPEGFARNECGGDLRDESAKEHGHGLDRHLNLVRWSNVFWDYDNDGWLDYVVVSGHVFYGEEQAIDQPVTVYRNLLGDPERATTFANATGDLGPGLERVLNARGAAFGDYDLDGLLDFAVVPNNQETAWLLHAVDGGPNRWIELELRQPGTANVHAIGAVVTLEAGGATQHRQVVAGSGFESTSTPRLHFGLGPATVADRVTVRWPDNETETWEDLEANGLYRLTRGDPAPLDDVLAPRTVAATDVEPLATGWYTEPVIVTLAASDRGVQRAAGVAVTRYRIDGGPWKTYDGPLAFESEGRRLLEFRSEDEAGNEEPVRALRIDVDLADPETTATVSPPPVFDGWHAGGAELTLAAADGFSGVAETWYRFDPAEPFLAYAGPVRIPDGDHDLESHSVDVAGRREPVRRLAVRVDDAHPRTTPEVTGVAGDDGWWLGPIQVTLRAHDTGSGVAGTRYRLGEGPESTYEDPIPVASDGVHELRFASTDETGNPEPEQKLPLRIDTKPPASTDHLEETPGHDGWSRALLLTMRGEDDGSGLRALRYREQGGEWKTHTGEVQVPDGRYRLETSARDVAGNEERPRVRDVAVDATPPETIAVIDGPAGDNGWWRGDADVTLSATDPTSGVARTERSLNGAPWGQGPVRVRGDGTHHLRYRSEDAAGNLEALRETAIRVDATPPGTRATPEGVPGRDGWWLGPVTLRFEAEDATSGVARVESAPGTEPMRDHGRALTLTPDGRHAITYRAVDAAGNAEIARTLEIPVDATPPATTATVEAPPGRNGWWRGDALVTLAADDATSGLLETTVALDGAGSRRYETPLRVQGDGVHALDHQSEDVAGNLEPRHRLLIPIDATAPTTRITLHGVRGDAGWYVTPVEATLEAHDATSGVARLHATNHDAPLGTSFTLHDGVHALRYHAEDEAGNLEAETSHPVPVDAVPPQTRVAATSGPSHARDERLYVTPDTRLAAQATDATSGVRSVRYRLENQPEKDGTETFNLSGEDGPRTLETRATDVAGNHEAPRHHTLHLDATPPTPTLRRPAPTPADPLLRITPGSRIEATAHDGDGAGLARITLRLNGVEVAQTREGTLQWTANATHRGLHVLTLEATDALGNNATLEHSLLILAGPEPTPADADDNAREVAPARRSHPPRLPEA